MGSAVEYYDFFLFGSAAALIFPKVFFPSGDEAAQILSFATFGVAYVARPVGAFVLGHFGDRIGRQQRADVHARADGCVDLRDRLPADLRRRSAGSRPALLVLCRLLQGFSAAGEQAGASSLTLEHAPDHRRAFFTSWTLTGTQGGLILASLVMIPFVSLPDDAELSLGLASPVLAQRRRRRGRLLHPPPAARDAGVRRGEGRRHDRPDAAQAAAARTTGATSSG